MNQPMIICPGDWVHVGDNDFVGSCGGTYRGIYAEIIFCPDPDNSPADQSGNLEIMPRVGLQKFPGENLPRWVKYAHSIRTALEKTTVSCQSVNDSTVIIGAAGLGLDHCLGLLNERHQYGITSVGGFICQPGRSWRNLSAGQTGKALKGALRDNAAGGGWVAPSRTRPFDREADERIWQRISVWVWATGAWNLVELVDGTAKFQLGGHALEKVLNYLGLLSCREKFFTDGVIAQLRVATSSDSALSSSSSSASSSSSSSSSSAAAPPARAAAVHRRTAAMRAVITIWHSKWDRQFTMTEYNTLLYKNIHCKIKLMAMQMATDNGDVADWSVLKLEPEAQALQNLLDSDERLMLFAEGVFRYEGAFYHISAKYGQWALCLLSAFPWARCLHDWAVLQPDNYRLGWTALNVAQSTIVSVLAETPRHRFASLAYLLTTASATLVTEVPLVEGFDETLMRTRGTHIHTHTHTTWRGGKHRALKRSGRRKSLGEGNETASEGTHRNRERTHRER
jgi:hypothetical protein